MFVAACFWRAGFATALAGSQAWKPAPGTEQSDLATAPGEISADRAVAIVREFARKCGAESPDGEATVRRLTNNSKRGGAFSVMLADRYHADVDVFSGEITQYADTLRTSERLSEQGAGEKPFLSNKIAAQIYVNTVACRLGVGTEKKLVEFSFEPPGNEEGRPAKITATFQPMPFGHRIRFPWGQSTVYIDPWDGVTWLYGKYPDATFVVESHEVKVSRAEAKAASEQIAHKYRVGQIRNSEYAEIAKPPEITRPSGLMYVISNGLLGGKPPVKDEKQFHLRLAYVYVYPYDEEIWIDAEDGKVLGGILYDPGPKRPKRAGAGG